MLSDELLCLFREDTVDNVDPYLWSDAEAYAYMNDAYVMFVRLTGGIPDATTAAVTTLTATEGENTTPLHDSIMRVRTARNVTLNKPITVINVQDEDMLVRDDYGLVFAGNNQDQEGRPDYLILGEEEGYVRWVNVPDRDYEIRIVVERLPLATICRPRQQFAGVRGEHHFHLQKWMRHLAYRKQDADTFDLVKSDQERDDFIAYCEFAKTEKGIRKHKVRTTSYGGL